MVISAPPPPPPPGHRRYGACICIQRLPQLINGLVGRLTNNIRNRFKREIYTSHPPPTSLLFVGLSVIFLTFRSLALSVLSLGLVRSCRVVSRRGSIWSLLSSRPGSAPPCSAPCVCCCCAFLFGTESCVLCLCDFIPTSHAV